MHSTVITLVIVIVIGFQAYVAYTAWKKIDLYRTIIPLAESFQTIKVYVPESRVKDIDINDILNNPERFSVPVFVDKEETTETEIITASTTAYTTVDTDEIGYEDFIWITKDNEEKKIKYKLLKSHEQAGWSRI